MRATSPPFATLMMTALVVQACVPADTPSDSVVGDAVPVMPHVGMVGTLARSINAGSGGLEVDADGNVYTGDFGATVSRGPSGTRVLRVTPMGKVSLFAEGFESASGNTIDATGRFFQASMAGNAISVVELDGSVRTVVQDHLFNPVGIVFDADGRLLVANCGSNTIVRVNEGGDVDVLSRSELLRCPNGITLGADGLIYVSNFYDGNVVRIDADGGAVVFATLPGGNNGHIVFGNGVFYVAARSAHQIYSVDPSGELRLLAGSGRHGQDDGPALEAALSFPNDLALSADRSTLYWNDVAAIVDDGGKTLTPTAIRMMRLR
jgi:sugar lactone lactonase YvrE